MLSCKPARRHLHGCARVGLAVIYMTLARPLEAQRLRPSGGLESKPAADSQVDAPTGITGQDPTVAAVLELPRETPVDTLVAVFTLLDLGAERMAEKLLAPMLKRPLTNAERVGLVAHFGSAKFLQLAQLERLGDEQTDGTIPSTETGQFAGARQFADLCLKAAADHARDPKRIATLISQLYSPQADMRHAARVDLQATGSAGVVACLRALATLDADPATDHQRQRADLLATLAGLHPATDAPLLAMLASCHGLLARDLAELAGHLHLSAAIPWLAGLAACAPHDQVRAAARQALAEMNVSSPSPEAMRALVLREIDQRQKDRSTPDQKSALWWSWTPDQGVPDQGVPDQGVPDQGVPAKKQLLSHEVTPKQFKILTLARLSSLLTSCSDPTAAEQQLALIYCLEAIPWPPGPKQPGPKQAVLPPIDQGMIDCGKQLTHSLSADPLSAALAESVRRDQLHAAIAIARQLGQLGDLAALASRVGRPAPLVRALRHPDAELRFAALQAIMQLAPEQSFAGSSYLPEALWTFAKGSGPQEALIVSPLTRRRNLWAGGLRELGYLAVPATTGREALQAAAQSTQLAVILIDASVSRPTAREIHYQLRASTQAGRVPMAIVCAGNPLLKFDRLAATDPLLLAVSRPPDQTRLAEMVEQLQYLADPPLASEAVRLERAEQALDWLAQLLQLPSAIHGNVYQELRRNSHFAEHTLFQPELAASSLRLLEHLGTADSQVKLVDYASDKSLPIENRRQAAAAFAASVEQYGMWLTTKQIRLQYDRYNASESDELQTQQVLGKLLDVIEAR